MRGFFAFRGCAAALLCYASAAGCAHDGGAYDGGAYDGGAYDGGAYDGGAHDGGAYDGGAYDGGAHDGGADDGGAYDGGALDGGALDGGAAAGDGGVVPCSVGGVTGQCLQVLACAAMPGYSATPGHCPGPADIQCCALLPSVASNPPVPAGWRLMSQSQVTPAMTAWAVEILHDPVTYPMFSTAQRTFGSLAVLARVEWHPPDFQNGVVHRGVTLYVPS